MGQLIVESIYQAITGMTSAYYRWKRELGDQRSMATEDSPKSNGAAT